MQPPPPESTHYENGRRVTEWRDGERGGRKVRTRWVYDARPGIEAWDEEIDPMWSDE